MANRVSLPVVSGPVAYVKRKYLSSRSNKLPDNDLVVTGLKRSKTAEGRSVSHLQSLSCPLSLLSDGMFWPILMSSLYEQVFI